MLRGAHLAPDFHSSPKHREPFGSVFPCTLTKREQTKYTWQKGAPLLLEATVVASRVEVEQGGSF